MQLQIITPEKILLEGDAAYVQIPGSEGEFGVLQGHAPVVSTLREGVISIELADGSKKEFAVVSGVAEVVPERVTLLVEVA